MVDWKDKMYEELAEVSEDVAEKYFKAIVFNAGRLMGDGQAEAYTKLMTTAESYADGVTMTDIHTAVILFMQQTEKQLDSRLLDHMAKRYNTHE